MAKVLGRRVDREERHDAAKIPRRVKKRPRFFFQHHPMRWMFVGGEWLPQLAKLSIDPGVNGVTEGGGMDLAFAAAMRRGWQIIQPSDPRLGEHQDYLVAYPHEAGGNTYLDPFQEVTVEAGRMFVDAGGENYYAFLRHLVAAGIVQPISANVVRVKSHAVEKKIERLQGAVSINPANQIAAGKLKRAEAMLAAMRKAAAAIERGKPRKKAQPQAQEVAADVG